MKMHKYIITILILITSCHTLPRWATQDDASIAKEFYNSHLTINKDGSYEEIVEMKLLILKEQGRELAANYSIIYNEESESYKIIDAKAITNGIEYKLEDSMIEDKELASNISGFDHRRKIRLTFPNVEIGSSLSIKFKYVKTTPVLDGYFSDTYLWESLYKSVHMKIKSKIPLHIKVNDPFEAFKITENNNNDIYFLEIETKKPLFESTINEPKRSTLNPKNQSWISLSSLAKWEDLCMHFAPHYERVANQDLPKEFEAIRIAAAQEKNVIDQINIVTSLLNEKIQYMSDMRTVAGRYLPHDLEKIIDYQLGDCKNFAVSTAAIVKRLGYKVQMAFVHRSTKKLLITNNLPDINNFNHIIVKVTDSAGKVYWIDPTNPVSMVDGFFPDIAGKMALILDSTEPSYEQIPNIDADHAQTIMKNEITIQDNTLIHKGYAEFKGENALTLAGSGMYASNEQLRDSIFQLIANTYLDPEAKIELILPDLKSRLVSDLKIIYTYRQDNGLVMTNFGHALYLNSKFTLEWNAASKYVGDLHLGTPMTFISHTLIKNTTVKQINRLNFEIDTPWVFVKRFCAHKDTDTIIIETIVIKQTHISAEDIKTQEYLQLEQILQKMYQATVVLVHPYDLLESSCQLGEINYL